MDVQFLKQSTVDSKAATVLTALFGKLGKLSMWDPNQSTKHHKCLCTYDSEPSMLVIKTPQKFVVFSSDLLKEAQNCILIEGHLY